MPSVEMRRSTRVFVPKSKDGDLVKVLRSGRRLWGEINNNIHHQQRPVKDGWFPLIDDHLSDRKPQPPRGSVVVKPDLMEKGEKLGNFVEGVVCRKQVSVIKNVYSRKRKRVSVDFDGGRKVRKFGLHFVRRRKRNDTKRDGLGGENDVLTIAFDNCCAGCSVSSRLLGCVLTYLEKRNVGFRHFSAFLVCSPVASVFSSYGIRFLLGRERMINSGACKISWERPRMMLFTINFAAIPVCFMGFYATILLRSLRISYSRLLNFHEESESARDYDGGVPRTDGEGVKIVVAGLEAGRVGNRTVHYRSGVLTRSSLKRRRRSLRNRRARNPSQFVMQKANGLPVCSNILFKKKGVQLPIFGQELRRSTRNNPLSKISAPKSSPSLVVKVPKSISNDVVSVPKLSPSSMSGMVNTSSSSSSVGLNVDTKLDQCCAVNVLVVETDRCFRIEGAEVALDLSNDEWVLAVRKDGMTRCQLKVQKEMRPNTLNRFTHAVVWAAENGWKLEFPNRKDWLVFKELYRLCGERNGVPASPVVKNIPVPEVSEVAGFGGLTSSFVRPESYIRITSDELSRVLSRRTANYDLDLEDEKWLREFNCGLNEANFLSEEKFELMIDAFEKASYCRPESLNDVNNAVSLCRDLASAEAAVRVYKYWLKRRELKRGPLLRVFELNEPKSADLVTKPVLRKKRSLKRGTACPSLHQRGRGKDSTVLQAIAVEQTVLEEQHAVLRAQEARASADKLTEVALLKRQRAQFLMENADLAMYHATMALRIAEAATCSSDSQLAVTHFLD